MYKRSSYQGVSEKGEREREKKIYTYEQEIYTGGKVKGGGGHGLHGQQSLGHNNQPAFLGFFFPKLRPSS